MIDATYDPRVAGEITRYHTWPRLRDQSVAEHTWQVMRILLTVWPECPRRLLIYAVWHDIDEMAGDIPYPFKRDFPALATGMQEAGKHVRSVMQEKWRVDMLAGTEGPNQFEKSMFKLCEYVEMWEHGLKEIAMGNKYAELVCDRTWAAMSGIIANYNNNLAAGGTAAIIIRNVADYVQRRIGETK